MIFFNFALTMIDPFKLADLTQLSDIKGIIPFEDVTVVDDTEEVVKKLMKGYVIIQFEGDELN